MQGPTKEVWLELCEQAANEQDPKKFLALITEINRLLTEKEARIANSSKRASSAQ
jgi:hypothetical protein